MKLIFFLVAFGLVFFRFYHLSTHHGKEGTDGNILMTGDNLYEKVSWSGRIEFNDAETDVESISPGGCLKFEKNEKKVLVESDKHGKLSYEISVGGRDLPKDEEGKKIVAEAIKEMIGFGFNLDSRIEKMYRKGGVQALLSESANMKMDNIKSAYLNRVFKCDSVSHDDLLLVLQQIKTMGNDMDRQAQLKHFTPRDWSDSNIMEGWMGVVQGLGSDMGKMDALEYFIKKGDYSENAVAHTLKIAGDFGSDMDKQNLISLLIRQKAIPENLASEVLNITSRFGSDMDKQNLISLLIREKMIPENLVSEVLDITSRFGSDMEKENLISLLIREKMIPENLTSKVLDIIGNFGSDMEKENVYNLLMKENIKTEAQWISLTNQTVNLGSDFEKSNMLVKIAQKMPKSDTLRTVYLKVAKTINSDADYGKAIKAVE